MLHSKKPPVARNFSEDGPFELRFEHNCNLTPVIFCGGRLRGQSILAVGRHSSVHMCADDASTAITWVVSCKLTDFYKNRTETSLHD